MLCRQLAKQGNLELFFLRLLWLWGLNLFVLLKGVLQFGGYDIETAARMEPPVPIIVATVVGIVIVCAGIVAVAVGAVVGTVLDEIAAGAVGFAFAILDEIHLGGRLHRPREAQNSND